jgi:hypothetical protein
MKENFRLEDSDYSVYKEKKRQQEINEEGPRNRREKHTYWIAVAGLVIAALSLLWQMLDKVM